VNTIYLILHIGLNEAQKVTSRVRTEQKIIKLDVHYVYAKYFPTVPLKMTALG